MLKHFISTAVILFNISSAHAALQIQSWQLANGAKVMFVENHTIPMLDVNIDFDAGARRDPQGKSGVATLTNALLSAGIQAGSDTTLEPAMSEAQLSDVFADIAAQQGGNVGQDRGSVTLRTLSSAPERNTAVFLLARLLAQPGFPADIFARDQARTLASLKEELTRPEAIARKAFSRLLYGAHPYGQSASVDSVSAIAVADLQAFHRTHYVANRAIVSLIGDVTRAQADAIAQQLTQRLPQGEALPALPPVVIGAAQEERIAHPASQAHILIGMPALERRDPDYFSLIVGNYVLGGGDFVARLMREVREKRGLTYGVSSHFSPMLQAGPFEIGLQTQKDQAPEALKVVRQTVADFLRDGPTASELKAAQDNMIGGFALRIDNNRKILDNIAAIGFYGMPLNYLDTWTTQVKQVTTADIKAAFQRKLSAEKMTTVVVGGNS